MRRTTRCVRAGASAPRCELPDRRKFRTRVQARIVIFEFAKCWCNPAVGTPHFDPNPRSIAKKGASSGNDYLADNCRRNRWSADTRSCQSPQARYSRAVERTVHGRGVRRFWRGRFLPSANAEDATETRPRQTLPRPASKLGTAGSILEERQPRFGDWCRRPMFLRTLRRSVGWSCRGEQRVG